MKIKSIPNPSLPTSASASIPRVLKMKTTQAVSPALVLAPPVAAEGAPVQSQVVEGGLNSPVNESQPEATKALSPQYVELARREKALRKLQQDVKAEQEAWKASQSTYISREALKADPFKALNEAGVSYEQLTQQPVAATPESTLQAKIDALESKLSSFDTRQIEKEKSEYQQAVKVISGDVELLVSSDPNFETIKATNSQAEVVRLIEQVFQAEGIILPVEDAAKAVEDKLLDRTLKQLETYNKLSKIKAKLAPPPAAEVDSQTQTTKPQTKTLTNAMGVQRPLSARERAILAFNRQLK